MIKVNLEEIDITKLFRSKAVTITVTLPIEIVYLVDMESQMQTNLSRSRVITKILEIGIREEKGQQLKEKYRLEEYKQQLKEANRKKKKE